MVDEHAQMTMLPKLLLAFNKRYRRIERSLLHGEVEEGSSGTARQAPKLYTPVHAPRPLPGQPGAIYLQ